MMMPSKYYGADADADADASIGATSTASSTVSEFLRKLIPREKWNIFFPSDKESESSTNNNNGIPKDILGGRIIIDGEGINHDTFISDDEEADDLAMIFDPIEFKKSSSGTNDDEDYGGDGVVIVQRENNGVSNTEKKDCCDTTDDLNKTMMTEESDDHSSSSVWFSSIGNDDFAAITTMEDIVSSTDSSSRSSSNGGGFGDDLKIGEFDDYLYDKYQNQSSSCNNGDHLIDDNDHIIFTGLHEIEITNKKKKKKTNNGRSVRTSKGSSGRKKKKNCSGGSGRGSRKSSSSRRSINTMNNYLRDGSFWLFTLTIILIVIVIIMVSVIRPFKNNNNNNNKDVSSSSSSSSVSNTNQTTTATTITIGMDPSPSLPPIQPATTINSPPSYFRPTYPSPTFSPSSIPTTIVTTNSSPIKSPSSAARPTYNEPSFSPLKNPTQRPTTTTPIFDASIIGEGSSVPGITSNNTGISTLEMGPMVGNMTYDSVTLWAYHGILQEYTMEILLYEEFTNNNVRKIDLVQPRKDRNNAIMETITGLLPSTEYKYVMYIQGQPVGDGSFRTAPTVSLPKSLLSSVVTSNTINNNNDDDDINVELTQRQQNLNSSSSSSSSNNGNNNSGGTKFDYILASCMDISIYESQRVWEYIYEQIQPNFAILAGDTIYMKENIDVDSVRGVNFDGYWYRNVLQRSEKYFRSFISNVPIYTTWNNHDYGSEQSYPDKDQKGKINSLNAFQALWINPGYGDSDDDANDGVYYSYYWGDVHYIVTDDHWYRDPLLENRLGIKQTKWLAKELIESVGTFKVIVIGSDIMQRDWSSDLFNIGTIVSENSINGVLFHAGDIHRNEYKRIENTGGFPYPVTQITSSGIAKVWRRPFAHIKIDTTLEDPSISAYFYGATSKTSNDNDPDLTWTNDPNLKCGNVPSRLTDDETRDKEHTCTETIRLSDLSVEV